MSWTINRFTFFIRESDGKIFRPIWVAHWTKIRSQDDEDDLIKWVGDDIFVSNQKGFTYKIGRKIMKIEHNGVEIKLEFDYDGFPYVDINLSGYYDENHRPTIEINLNDKTIHPMFECHEERMNT